MAVLQALQVRLMECGGVLQATRLRVCTGQLCATARRQVPPRGKRPSGSRRFKGFQRLRLPDEVALEVIHPELPELPRMRFGLYAFGNQRDIERLAHGHDRLGQL